MLTAYSPLGSPDNPWKKPEDPSLLEDPKIIEIAEKYNKSPAQILIKFQIQKGIMVIPKSITKSRIESNFNVWDFELEQEDVDNINTFDSNGRFVHMKGYVLLILSFLRLKYLLYLPYNTNCVYIF